VGAAKLIDLYGQEGKGDGYAFEIRRLLDGSLILRIIEPGRRAGIGMPASTPTSDLARALSQNVELRIKTVVGLYSLQREQNHVRISYFQFEDSWLRVWKCELAAMLNAMKELMAKAA
jgi:hypothetical protein